MKASETEKTITVMLIIVLLITAVVAVILLLGGGFNKLPWVKGTNPLPGLNYMNREDAALPVDKEFEAKYTAVSFMVNRDRVMEHMQSMNGKTIISAPPISPEQYLDFGESEYLGGSVLTASIGVNSITNIYVVDEQLGGGLDDRRIRIQSGVEIPMFMMSLQGGKFEEFKNGSRSVAEGRMPKALNECMVSEELARTAGLSVGNTLSLSSFLEDKDRNRKDIGYELTIVGIYRDSTSKYANGANRNAYTNRRNEILTRFETVGASIPEGYTGARLSATYYLKSPELLDKFAKEVYAKGLDPVYDVVYVGLKVR